MKRKQVVSSKKVIFMYHKSKQEGISSREIQQKQRSCGSAEKNECKKKKILSETLERPDEDDVEIPLRTRTTTRQRYDEIKKQKAGQRRSGQQRCLASLQSTKDSSDGEVWSAGLVWGGGEEEGGVHLNTFFFNSLCCRRCFVIVVTPSSLLRRTLTRPRSRNTPPRCGARGSWPRHCRRARV